jgi:hypothetical protein
MSDDLRIRAIQSTLDLERQIATRTSAELAEARELLRQVAAELRAAERAPLAQEHPAVAAAHAALAERIEAHLARPRGATTQGGT